MSVASLVALMVAIAAAAGMMPRAANALPDGRAYELVTAGDMLGGTVDRVSGGVLAQYTWMSPDGDHVMFDTLAPPAGTVFGKVENYTNATRTPAGWSLLPLWPAPLPGVSYPAGGEVTDDTEALLDASADLRSMVMRSPLSYDSRDPGGIDVYVRSPAGMEWASQPRVGDAPAIFRGMSASGDHVVFASNDRLLAIDGGREDGDGLYDRSGGVTYAVALGDDGQAMNPCGARIAGDSLSLVSGSRGAPVSDDGSRIYFTTGTSDSVPGCSVDADEAGQLYVRIDHKQTVLVSPRRRDVPDAIRQTPTFQMATPDGNRVFFTSPERLTNAEPGDVDGSRLYAFDLPSASNPDGTLTDLTPTAVDASGAPTAEDPGAGVVAGAAKDGRRVYFLATGKLTADAPSGPDDKLYLSDDGQLRYVGVISAPPVASTWTEYLHVSSDGSKAAFLTDAPLTGANTAGRRQAFLFDADAPTGDDVVCVSCSDRTVGGGDAALGMEISMAQGATPESLRHQRQVVTNGGHVFFESPDALAPDDHNTAIDVYEYVPSLHRVGLLTAGTSDLDAGLIGVSSDGRTAAFVTFDALLPEDDDNGDGDVYVARIGGGFPSAPARRPCDGDDCQGEIPKPPVETVPGSLSFVGPGSKVAGATPPGEPVFHVRPLTPRQRAKLARGGSVALLVDVSGAGRLRAAVRARFGTRVLAVTRAQRIVRRGGTARLRLRLSRAARRVLRQRGALRVVVAVHYTTADRTQRVAFKLRKKRAARRTRRAGALNPAGRRGSK